LRIIFAGTPEFAKTALVKLCEAKCNIVAVYTQPDRPAGRGQHLQSSPVKTFAVQHAIPVYQPASLRDPEAQKTLTELKPDLMIVAAYGLILPQVVLSLPTFGCINIHASLLPRWRGAAPIQRAIMAGDTQTGITIMQMDAGLDTGDMLLQMPCEITPEESSGTLLPRLADMGAKGIMEIIAQIEKKALHPLKQDSDKATYAAKISKSEAFINWKESAVHLDRCIRAFNPWPVVYSYLGGERVRIWRAKPILESSSTAEPGSIISITENSIHVATGEGRLALEVLQFPGGKPIDIKTLLSTQSQKIIQVERFE
jgi:methionyl-tRNA formyltransferase